MNIMLVFLKRFLVRAVAKQVYIFVTLYLITTHRYEEQGQYDSTS